MANDKENMDYSATSAEPGDLSKLLVQYREEANMSMDQVSEALCLTSSAIKALESEDFDRLPEPPYVRGYLRSYARIAETDPSHIIDVYNSLRGVPTEPVMHLHTSEDRNHLKPTLITPQRFRLGLLTSALLLLAILSMIPGVRNWFGAIWSSFSEPSTEVITETTAAAKPESSLPSLTGDLPGNLPIDPEKEDSSDPANDAGETVDSAEESAPSAEGDTTEAKTEESATDTPAPETTAEQQAEAAGEEQTTPESEQTAEASDQEQQTEGDTKLRFVFKEQVWMRIQDNTGKTVFQGLNPAGTEKELMLNAPLKLRVGNAPGMTLFVNGKEMDTSTFIRGSVANFGIE